MRKLSHSILLVGPLLVSLSSLASAQEDPVGDPAADPAAEEAADTAEPDTAVADESVPVQPPDEAAVEPPAAAAEANVGASVSTGGGASTGAASTAGIVQMGDAGKPSGPQAGPQVNVMSGGGASVAGPSVAAEDEWKFGFHGYMRAPMRFGIGERDEPKKGQAVTTLSTPRIPTDQYLDWQYTQSAPRSTAELFFSYGNNWARGVVSIQAFRFSDSAWIDPESQSGITLGWVELTPDLSDIVEDLRMIAKVGSFWGRFGGAGQYDAGAYETYVIGRSHMVGESVRLEYDYDDFVWYFEEGFGTKQPNPSPFHNTKFTLLARAHAGFTWDQFLSVGLHYMHAWTQEQDHECSSEREEVLANETPQLLAQFASAPVGACKHETILVTIPDANGSPQYRADTPDGSLQVIGADVVLNTAMAGRLFIGASHIIADKAVTVAPVIEVIHAYGGGFFKSGITHQYLNERENWDNPLIADGDGSVSTLSFQWDLSVASLIELPQQLDLQTFAMFNYVNSEDDPDLEGMTKLKYGADLLWGPVSWFGVGMRFDRLQPRSNVPEQSFTVLAPRLVFRSDFATHEEITIGYAKYFYAQRECENYSPQNPSSLRPCVQPPGATASPDGFGSRPGTTATKEQRGGPIDVNSERGQFPDQGWQAPHEDVFYISADIWW